MMSTYLYVRRIARALLLGTVVTMSLPGCGGGGSSSGGGTTTPSNPTPSAVDGVATPASISVVTANNAE